MQHAAFKQSDDIAANTFHDRDRLDLSAKCLVTKVQSFSITEIINVMMEVDNNGDDVEEKYVPGSEDDDPVVYGMPVYLNKSVSSYLFQYPVRPASMQYPSHMIAGAKFRPNNKQVQLEVRLNTASDNYDKSKGEQIALNTDGVSASSSAPRYFNSRHMDKQILSGVSSGGDSRRYAFGRVENNELHLTGIQGVLQLRPSLSYMDKSDKTAKAEGRLKDDPDDPGAEDEQPQAVTVKFSRVSLSHSSSLQFYIS